MSKKSPNGWDAVADWYSGWTGKTGSKHHRKIAIPAMMKLLEIKPNMHVVDVGAGTGVLCPAVVEAGARYTGIDISPRLIRTARQHHGSRGNFIVGDARKLPHTVAGADACAFLLSIQDMNPLDAVLQSACAILKPDGVMAMVMTHPCFRIPRQSGWGYDAQRKLQYRRVDRYLTPLNVPMKQHRRGATISFHRPLSAYFDVFAACRLVVDRLDELTTYVSGENRAEQRAHDEIPLFLAIRARLAPA